MDPLAIYNVFRLVAALAPIPVLEISISGTRLPLLRDAIHTVPPITIQLQLDNFAKIATPGA